MLHPNMTAVLVVNSKYEKSWLNMINVYVNVTS
jgi:hypothetical protein